MKFPKSIKLSFELLLKVIFILRIASHLKSLLRKIHIKISNDIEKEEISQITEITEIKKY